ncbi:neuronal acetylcholine receptor subunit alpha-10-like [Ptychodera flava]|uniref:neuronal acetylcholine receptor subunit alpha-10-like n=1 Tax=Ptychodera flava TaxID=63121 RepID=UPI00396A1A4E
MPRRPDSVHNSVIMPSSTLALLSLLILVHDTKAVRTNIGQALVKDLFTNYSNVTRPTKNGSVVVVQHRMTPIQLIDINEKEQSITLKSWCGLMWTDEHLTWNATKYNGREEIQVPTSKIWQPDIALYGSVGDDFTTHYDTDARVTSSGQVTALRPFVFKSSCQTVSTYFPFDIQRCLFTFGSVVNPLHLIDTVPSSGSNTDNFIGNGEWDIVEMIVGKDTHVWSCCPDQRFGTTTYAIIFKRRYVFYALNVMLPTFLVSALVVIGFCIPSDTGERMTLSVSSMLSLMVVFSTVKSYMPMKSERIPYLQQYFLTSVSLVTLSCVTTAMTLTVHFRGPKCRRPPPWMRRLVFDWLSALLCTSARVERDEIRKKTMCCTTSKRRRRTAVDHIAEGRSTAVDIPPTTDFIHLSDVSQTPTTAPSGYSDDGRNIKTQMDSENDLTNVKNLQEWREIARIADRLVLWIYVIIVVTVSAGFVLGLITNSDVGSVDMSHL